MGTNDKRAAIYNRVSAIGQGAADKPMADLSQIALQRGYVVALEVAETGSGARNDRPGLQRILEAARRGKIDAVIVTRLDRFGRSAPDLLANIRTLRDAGVTFLAVEQGLVFAPASDAVSQLLLTVLSGVAEFEREIIRERVVAGQRRAKARGIHIGRPFVPGPDVEAVRELRAAGKSWAEVGEELGCHPSLARRRLSHT